jgi:dihydrofolate reductase
MRNLVYSMMVSLDGFIEGPDPELDWAAVDDPLHQFVNDLVRASGGYLFGRRVYDVMAGYWDTAGANASAPAVEQDFAQVWQIIPKVVFSRTLERATEGTRILRDVVPDEINRMKQQAGGDMQLAGANLAESFEQLGLIDEYALFVHPVTLGGGKRFFAAMDTWRKLRLVETKQFDSGVLYLRYVRSSD